MTRTFPWNFLTFVFVVSVATVTLYLYSPSKSPGQQALPLTPNSAAGFEGLDQAITQATEFLLARQGNDGAWHSERYGSMRQGAANTALVLYALSQLSPEDLESHADAIQRARNFLLPGIEKTGCVSNPDGSLDYPVYSTALILTVDKRIDLKLKPAQTQRMVNYLLDSQCMEPRGFTLENPNHGGWDILGPGPTRGKTAGTNVSVTFFVVEALAQFRGSQPDQPTDETPEDSKPSDLPVELGKKVDAALLATNQWSQRIQANEGGFYFTSKRKSALNKAGWDDKQQTSPSAYGSATCDGLGLLLQLGETPSGKPVQSSLSWLAEHPGVDAVPGFKSDLEGNGWPASLKFYYLAALSRSLSAFESDENTATSNAIIKQLLDNQFESGAWRNEASLMRENDELIATPFGLIALLNCKSILAQAESR